MRAQRQAGPSPAARDDNAGSVVPTARAARRRGLLVRVVLAATLLAPATAHAHPLHTTITEITEDPARGVIRATIRVFADDFGTAVAKASRWRSAAQSGPAWDAAAFAYVASVFGFTDKAGRALSLRSCGTRRTTDLLWICVETDSRADARSTSLRNGVLCDLFDDQVNVVQGTLAGARRSLLFTRGDRAKKLL